MTKLNGEKRGYDHNSWRFHFPHTQIIKRLSILSVIGLILFFVSFAIGRYYVPVIDVIKILFNLIFPLEPTWSSQAETVVLQVRLPRIIAAILVGGALAAAGSVFQGIFKNPLVSPDIMGASAGAGFGAALGLLLSFGYYGTSTTAFILGLVAVFIALVVGSKMKNNPTLGMVLAGIMVGSLFTAGVSFIKLVADPMDELPAITYWLMGSLASIRLGDLLFLFVPVLVGIVPLFLLRWHLNMLTLEDDEARAMGLNIRQLRIIVIICATLTTSACVAMSGMIGWVGLVIPHFARKMVGCNFQVMLPTSIVMGAGFLLAVDDLARIIASSEIPLGILTAFVGAPFFLHLILKKGREII
ncbi:MAG: FecCD family ABC transporter permease [Thermacetogeniaceae bacterium]|jgi:iron complex transport system permease protein|nr:iron ABC transporter permease [Thermoanaerobacterales bacterium]HAF17494.1 ABC transporter permease [Peptococcaceae bacterium]